MADRNTQQSSLLSMPHMSAVSSNPDIFSDEFALDDIEPVADGRPPNTAHSTDPSAPAAHPQVLSPINSTNTTLGGSQRRNKRISQRSVTQSSVSSRLSGEGSQMSRIPDSDLTRTSSMTYPSVRTISTFGLPRSQSPYQGATGPSHPYGMYAQDVSLSRTPSVATTSTLRQPERSYSGPGGPSQPYGMYSQNTVPEDEDQEVANLAPPVVSGMPGRRPEYQRRLGPDGEDADDLIGPDGHLEQLPPYSRYANGIPPKIDTGAASFVNAPLQESQGPQSMMHDSISGPLIVQRLPETQVQGSSQNRLEDWEPSTATNPFDDSSAQSASPTSEDSLPKEASGSFKERVREKGRSQVCCGLMPCWLLVFVVVVLALAVLLGGIVGGVVAHHSGIRPPPPQPPQSQLSQGASNLNDQSTATTTATLTDATPIATPADLPILPTGSFAVALQDPSAMANTCLPPSQRNAWDCSTGADLNLSVGMSQGGPIISITYPQKPNTPFRYGAQPPTLNGPANLVLMKDKAALDKGPAYYFTQPFNKTVIIRSQDLAGLTSNHKRASTWLPNSWGYKRQQSDWAQGDMASPSDQPWFCYWNNTYLEGFIYLTQNENNSTTTGSQAAPTGTSSSPPAYPKVVKIGEHRPPDGISNPPAYCQQMQILDNWRFNPVSGSNGQPINLVETEVSNMAQRQYDRNTGSSSGGGSGSANQGPSASQVRRQAGSDTRCSCEWPGMTL